MKRKIVIVNLLIIALIILLTNNVNATMSLEQLQNTYPTGSKWTDEYWGTGINSDGREEKHGGRECYGFAALMYYNYYGIDPFATADVVYDVEQVQPGDIVRYHNDGHSVWVLSRNGENVQVAECNYDYNCSVRWWQPKTMSELRNGFNYIYHHQTLF